MRTHRVTSMIHLVAALLLPFIRAGLPPQYVGNFVNPETLGVQMFRLTGALVRYL